MVCNTKRVRQNIYQATLTYLNMLIRNWDNSQYATIPAKQIHCWKPESRIWESFPETSRTPKNARKMNTFSRNFKQFSAISKTPKLSKTLQNSPRNPRNPRILKSPKIIPQFRFCLELVFVVSIFYIDINHLWCIFAWYLHRSLFMSSIIL